MRGTVGRMGAAASVAVVSLMLSASVALAAPNKKGGGSQQIDPGDAAKNLGGILTSWGTFGFGGVVAVMGVVLLAGRKSAEMVRFGMMALIAGGFIFATSTVIAVIRGIWGSL